MPDTPDQSGKPLDKRLAKLDERIAAHRRATNPLPRKEPGKFEAASMAWRMVIELVVSVMVGAAMGWGLDSLFGSLPVFLIVFVMLGFAAGVRGMLRTAKEMQRKQVAQATKDD